MEGRLCKPGPQRIATMDLTTNVRIMFTRSFFFMGTLLCFHVMGLWMRLVSPGWLAYFAWYFWISVLQDFVDLLREQAPLESYVEWLDKLVETKIIRVSRLQVMCRWSLHSIAFCQLCGKCFIYDFVIVFFQPCEEAGDDFKSRAQEFLLRWSFLGARLMHNLTLNASSYFGEIKLISCFNNLNQSSHIFI